MFRSRPQVHLVEHHCYKTLFVLLYTRSKIHCYCVFAVLDFSTPLRTQRLPNFTFMSAVKWIIFRVYNKTNSVV
jgi:hypothetical protein